MIIKQQKPIKVGNSYAMTIDPAFFRAAGIKPTNDLTMRYAPEGAFITVLPTKEVSDDVRREERANVMESKITPEFRQWMEDNLEKNKEAFKELAHL